MGRTRDHHISFPFSELSPQLAAHPFFLKEAEEIRPDIRQRLARKNAEPDDLIRELFDYVEHFREALYDTFLTLDGEALFPQELEENSDNDYDRYQVYGLGGVYWVVEKEPVSLEVKMAEKWSPDLYITFDDAASIARQRIPADGEGVRLYYEAWTSRGILAHLEEETERVALFDASLDEDPNFAKIVESEKRAHWYPSLFLAREKPLPQKGSRNSGLDLKRLMHAAQEAAEHFHDSDLTFRFHFGSEQ